MTRENIQRTHRSTGRGLLFKACAFLVVALLLVAGYSLFRIYGTDTHHADRNSIWWTERGRNLIPPGATDITLRQDLLDHYATYKVSEQDLNDFLNKRFAINGKVIDSFGERTPADAKSIGKEVGPLGWIVTEDTVVYSYAASNGGMHNYYHDSTTGMTYQESAYW